MSGETKTFEGTPRERYTIRKLLRTNRPWVVHRHRWIGGRYAETMSSVVIGRYPTWEEAFAGAERDYW